MMEFNYLLNCLYSKIIENPNVTEEDVGYVDEGCGGDNPIMIAARCDQFEIHFVTRLMDKCDQATFIL